MMTHDLAQNTDNALKSVLWDILARHPLFGILPAHVVEDLLSQFTVRRYDKACYIFHQEDPAERFFVILGGEISIERFNREGRVTRIAQLFKGDIFGEFALIDKGGRSASARVSRYACLASLSVAQYNSLVDSHPEFAKKLMSVLVQRLRGSNSQVESLVTQTLLQRTARLLISLDKAKGSPISVTQRQLGERLHASREKVNGKLKELENLGAIKTGRGQINILNAGLLIRTLEFD